MATATELVSYLLELNILNADEARQELAHIAARIRNPIGQKWMNRVGWYAINNIDKLVDIPRTSTGSYQPQNSPDYPAFHRTDADPAHAELGPDESDFLHRVEDGETLTELSMQYFDDPSLAPLLLKLNPKLQYEVLGRKERPRVHKTSSADAAKTDWVFGDEPVEESAGIQSEGSDHGLDHPIAGGQQVRIPSKARLAHYGLFTRGSIPKNSAVKDITPFTSKMWQQDIEQNFSPLKPNRRKKISLPGDQPTSAEMPTWAAGKEGGMHHFDPIMASRRELWQDLVSVTHYLNYVSAVNAEEHPEYKREQTMLFKHLETAAASDLKGFLDILAKAREWHLEVKNNPWKFVKGDPTLVYKHKNGFAWKQMETVEDLKREGEEMPHCVGNYTYTSRLTAGTHSFFSLRDQSDKPYVTVEVDNKARAVLQIKGPNDITASLPPAHKLMAKEFIEKYLSGYRVIGDTQSIAV